MDDLKLSVIIPVYNVENYLRHCLDSVLTQTYRNLEIILVDDGSKDASGMICDEYAAKDSRIKCVHQENAGVSRARNRGLEMASGDYYHFLDSDDFIEPDTYEYLLTKMQENGAEAIALEYFTTFADSEIASIRPQEHCGLRDTEGAISEHLFGGNDFLCTKLLPAFAVKDLRFHEDIYRDEDTLFGFEAICRVKRMYFDSRPLLHYVQSEESACRGVFRPSQLSAVKVIPIMEEKLGKDFPSLLPKWRAKFLNLMTTLYRDMYLDEVDYTVQQKDIYQTFCEMYRKVKLRGTVSTGKRVKYRVFRISPKLFCRIHKLAHHL